MNQTQYLKKCLELMEEKLNWGNSSEWTNVKFEILSDRLREVSGDSPSVKTLKRLFGRAATYKEEYIPQLATKNVLARFLGFNTWEAFTSSDLFPQAASDLPEEELPVGASAAIAVLSPPPGWEWKRFSVFGRRVKSPLLVVTVLAAVAGIVLVWYRLSSNKLSPTISYRVKTRTQPYQLSFEYDLSRINTDSIYLAWEQGHLPLPKKQHQATYTFSIPDYYQIGLFAGGRKIAHVRDIHALSGGWVTMMAGRHYPGTFPHPGLLYVSPQEVRSFGIAFKEYWVEYRNIRDFDISGDNFTFETSVKNSPSEGGIDCYDTELEIVGEKGKIRAAFLKPGCHWHGKLDLGEVHLRGDSTDLSAFCTDLADWRTIRIAVKNQHVQFLLDHKVVYQKSYQTPIGSVKGIICRFKGSGAVDKVFLVDSQNKIVYSDGFGD